MQEHPQPTWWFPGMSGDRPGVAFWSPPSPLTPSSRTPSPVRPPTSPWCQCRFTLWARGKTCGRHGAALSAVRSSPPLGSTPLPSTGISSSVRLGPLFDAVVREEVRERTPVSDLDGAESPHHAAYKRARLNGWPPPPPPAAPAAPAASPRPSERRPAKWGRCVVLHCRRALRPVLVHQGPFAGVPRLGCPNWKRCGCTLTIVPEHLEHQLPERFIIRVRG